MNRRLILIIFLAMVLTATSGCSTHIVENNTIEEIAPVIFWYIKDGQHGQLNVGTLVPPMMKEEGTRLLTMNVSLLRQAGEKFNLNYYREIRSGQLRILLIDSKLAAKGLGPLIKAILSETEISQRLYLVIVEGDVEEYIRGQMQQQPDLDYYLYRMLRHYERKRQGDITIVNLHQYMKRSHSKFSDPTLPVFKAEKANFIYKGTGVMKEDKLVDTLTGGQEQAMQLLGNDHYLEYLSIPSLNVSIGRVRAAVKVTLNKQLSSVSFQVNTRGRVNEYRGEENLLDPKGLNKVSSEIESYLEEETKNLIKRLQQRKVDPFEIGKRTLSPFRKPISDQQWLNAWEHMNIKVKYQLDLESVTGPKG